MMMSKISFLRPHGCCLSVILSSCRGSATNPEQQTTNPTTMTILPLRPLEDYMRGQWFNNYGMPNVSILPSPPARVPAPHLTPC